MKKLYVTPKTEIIETELSTMLCISTPFGNDADEPAGARELFSDEDDWEIDE